MVRGSSVRTLMLLCRVWQEAPRGCWEWHGATWKRPLSLSLSVPGCESLPPAQCQPQGARCGAQCGAGTEGCCEQRGSRHSSHLQLFKAGSCREPGSSRDMERMDVTETFSGISLPGHLHTQESLSFAVTFPFRPTDVVIATYPKSGTTWMQEILTLLFSHGDVLPAKTIPNWERAPWLEQVYFREALQDMRDTAASRLITTHLPARILAPALQQSKAKVIYVARNPKDVAVSFYHFHRLAKFLPDPGSFDTFLTQFLEGTVHYGSWFDHVKGWLGQRQLLDIFYVTYEELHQDLRGTAQRLSAFLGCPLEPETLAALEQHCSFATMRDNAMANYTLIPIEIMDHSQGCFMRKGVVGDWRDHFSPWQNTLFNRLYQEEMGDLELPVHWPMA
ncbi:sulfotransferase 1A1-like [Lathamus discolor]|uniref:sulfotransferase 1A1-like n=1 Tax=Lathamus discolor TaxID=678569 RepID=UPI0032B7BF3C